MKHLILKRLKQNAVIKKQANILRRFKKLQAEHNPIITGGAYHIQSTQSQNKQRVKVTKSLSALILLAALSIFFSSAFAMTNTMIFL